MEDKGQFDNISEELATAAAETVDGEAGDIPATQAQQPTTSHEAPEGEREMPQEKGDEAIKTGYENNKASIENTRSVIAFRFVIGFFGVVFLVFVTGWSGIFEESTFKDMLLTIVGTLSSSLGFIIGYYFKSSEGKGGRS